MKSSPSNKKKSPVKKKNSAASLADKTLSKAAGGAVIKSANLFPVVGIGASAGGLDAFKKLLKAITEDSGMAYVLVQHLDPSHESLLPEILQKVTAIPVLEITDDIKVQPDHIYVIPSNKMMVATDGVLLLAPRPAKSTTVRNLPIDLFFTSLAEVHLEQAIGVVLSGTASDGTQGLRAIKDHGGITFAQDEESAEYEGMPLSAIQAGVVDFILPPGEIPKKLLEITSKTVLSDDELQNIPKQDEDVFRQILSLLRIRKGVDFTYYKQTTVRRRILRRMVVNKNEEPRDYLNFLRANNPEQDLLYQDMLIPVTSFFRDKKTFENLCNNVFPSILKNKIPGEITRIWVAGCSTGQEVYSFAICFKEFLGDNHERLQIFGTDLSEPAIIKARTGIYEKSEIDDVSPERLKEYFTKNNGGYQVNKSIRDMCVFAHHNFLKDPPFGKMDCISCRNVLIYMEPYLQKKALTTFHYALNPKGFLLLGKSETTGGVPDLFAAVQKNDKLYTRKDVPGRFIQVTSQRSEQILSRAIDNSKTETIRTDFQKTADDILLTKYTPAGVVVNEAMDIVHFRGNTGNYLEQAPGKPSHNLLMMAKQGLGFELRNILHKVKNDKAPVIKENIPLHVNGPQGSGSSLRNISIEAVPLPNTLEPYYLILFHDNTLNDTDGSVISNKRKVSVKTKKDEKDIRIQLLEQELAQAREDMRSITEEQEASNEELQSANEELLSGSEELQSLNEELETSKEELQSTNEELTVLNHELVSLNEQVTDARNYSESIVATLYQPLLVLDKNLRVKTANKAFYKTFNVNEQETEGVLIYDLGNRQWNIPQLRTMLEEILPQKKQIGNFEVRHNFTSIGERIILLNGLEITREKKEEKLILLSIEDITEHREAEKEKLFLSTIVESTDDAIISKNLDGIITSWNKGAEKIFGYSREQAIGKHISMLIPPELKQEEDMVIGNIKKGQPVLHYETIRLSKNGTRINVSLTVSPIKDAAGKITGASKIAKDITERKKAQEVLNKTSEHFRHLVKGLPAGVYSCDAQGYLTFYNEAAEKLWGRIPEIGKDRWSGSWKMFKPDGSPLSEESGPMAMTLKKGRAVVGEEVIIERPDGSRSMVMAHPQPEFGLAGEITGAINMIIDITEQKKAALELTEAIVFAELATDIAEEAKLKAEEATHTAEDAVKAKQQFLSNMSHEIRTPMNAIIGFTKVVLKTELTAKQREYLTAIKLSGNSLIVLINDILDLAKVDAGKMTFEEIPFRMESSISAMVHLFEIKIQEKNLELVKEYDDRIPPVLLGDPVRLHQIILNLVSNAVKFTSKGKITVSLRLLSEDEESATIEFAVTDTGTGIPEDKTEQIFEKFHQAASDTSRLYGGTGLGLAIVKQLVESQGGKINVKSKIGEGSVFSFAITFKKTNAQAEADAEIIEIDTTNKNIKVLVVEDIALNQLLMKTLLDDFGFERDIAANGKIAIEKLQDKTYDIILMDLQMPEMNGFEATTYIRNNMNSDIPIIALTADVTTVDLEKCKAVGMNDYIAKPVDERLLYNKIINLVKNPVEKISTISEADEIASHKKNRCTDLAYLISITKFNEKLMMEMIALYLDQTPVLINTIKKSLQDADWGSLQAAAHKLVPSFSIMGISKDFEVMAKKVQEYTGTTQQSGEIHGLVLQLENVCAQACIELEEEYTTLKNTKA